jgi:molybdopterin molybdotransferase
MQEKISMENDLIIPQDHNLKKGSNVREIGSEIRAGQLAMAAGTVLSPAAIGFLAGIGVADIDVIPSPKVAIIITGNELKKPGEELDFGQVYESNSFSLSAALSLEGINQVSILHAEDDLAVLTHKLNEALRIADVVLLTGGVSVGDYDYVVQASSNCGIRQIFHKIKQKPGKPLYFGKKDTQLIFGLPGNPSSVLSCYYNYVLPALKQLSRKENSTKEITAKLAASCSKPTGLTHFLKGIYDRGTVTALNAQESFRLISFAHANCLISLEEEETDFHAGQTVNVILLP